MKGRWVLGAALLLASGGAASVPRVERTNDTNAVLALLKGDVDVYGDRVGSVAFQRGVVERLRAGTIRVRALTSKANAANMKPLKTLGATVNTLPSRFTGALIVVRGRAVIVPSGGGYLVMRGAAEVAGTDALMAPYWQASSRY